MSAKRPGGRRRSASRTRSIPSLIACRSHLVRSWSASSRSRPSVPTRAALLASVSRISATSPATSWLSGSSVRSILARSSARSTRSRRSRSLPAGAVCPVVKSRWITVSTASIRAGSSLAGGTRYGIRAAAIFFFALVMRAAIVGSLTRKARPTSAVVSPHSSRRVSATCASGAIAGWQQVKISRSRSSAIAWEPVVLGPGSIGSSISSGRDRRSVASRRSRSTARRRATVVSHAPALAGTPRETHVARARAYASWTHSSARSRSLVTRTAAASTKAHSRRCASATAAATAGSAAVLTVACAGPAGWRRRSNEHPAGAHFDPAERRRDLFGYRDGVVQVRGLDEIVAAERLLRLGERPVRDGRVAGRVPADAGGGSGRLQRVAAAQPRGVALTERLVPLQHLFIRLLICAGPGSLVFVDQDQVLRHGASSLLSRLCLQARLACVCEPVGGGLYSYRRATTPRIDRRPRSAVS